MPVKPFTHFIQNLSMPEIYLLVVAILLALFGLMWKHSNALNVCIKLALFATAFLNVAVMIKDWPQTIAFGANTFLFTYLASTWDTYNTLNTTIKVTFSGLALWGATLLLIS